MSKPSRSWVAALCGVILLALSTAAALAERRVALVVGNSQYKNPNLVLFNPRNDAEDVAAALRTLGFEVIMTVDAGRRDLDLAMIQFARLATAADAALFFYAGHALQYQGRNYLMPIDAELEDEISLRYQMMLMDDVRVALERAGGVKIMILDACRNNPVVDRLKRKMVGVNRNVDTVRGLARIDKTEGIVVAYATAADEVAADGSGRNSPFTSALLKRLQEPGLEIGKMFRHIAADVNEQTHGRQRPEIYVSLIDEYYLNRKDRVVWDQIKDSTDPAAFRDFVGRFPSSPQAPDAQYRLQMLERLARERQLERERAEREAAQRQAEEQRAKLAAAERERVEREAAQRQAEEQRAKLAAVERERVEREAAQRQAEEQRAKLAAAERQRAEREAVQRQAEEQRAKLAAAERERAEREAALRQAEEQRAKLAAAEREKSERDAGQRHRDDDRRAKAEVESARAEAERQNLARATPDPPPANLLSLPMTQEQVCRRDEATLARLRTSQARDEVIRFERELGCERLRPQLLRLRESIFAEEERSERDIAQQPQAEQQHPKSDTVRPTPERDASAKGPPMSISQDQICKRDAERLARLRVSQAHDEVIRFERELGCEKLRPQVVRLRESVGPN